ncbi:MAG TPA: patatin-like phospholipase family protein, partial [Bacteroidota bacterium]|nr:patatin-like phospholipase family protein [Bacteroidota bacterium]
MKSRLPNVFLLPILIVLQFPLCVAQDGTPSPVRTYFVRPDLRPSEDRFPNLVESKSIARPRVALVLSGGGARGMAAIGVLQALEANNIRVDLVVGTSMGSIVGGLYASGYTPQEMKSLADTTNWADVISYSDESARRDLFLDQKSLQERNALAIRFSGFEPIIPSAFSTGQRLTNLLNILSLQAIYHPNPSFDDLGVRYRAVSTDLVSGKQIVLGKGDLSEAMRGSMAVPLLFTPVSRDSLELVDGGLISNIPVDVAKKLGADIVIAVDVTSPLRPRSQLTQFWEVGDQIMGIMMQASNREQLAKADVVIRPSLEGRLSSDFVNLDDIIRDGEVVTDSAVAAIKAKIRGQAGTDSTVHRAATRARLVLNSGEPDSAMMDRWHRICSLGPLTESTVRTFIDDLYETGDYERVGAEVRQSGDSSVVALDAVRYPLVTSVEFHGNVLIASDTLSRVVGPLLNKHVNANQSREILKDLLRLYRERGYSLARFQEVQFDPQSGKVDLTFDEGVIYRMDIKGTEKTRDYVIWRELPFGRGDVFQISKVAQGIRNLNGTYLFEQVVFTPRLEDGRNVIDIRVKERSTELLRLGIRIDNERNIQPSFDVRDDNFLGIGAELGAGYFGGLLNRNYYTEFKARRIFNSYFTFDLRGYYKLYDFYTYDYEPAHDDLHWNRFRTGEYREQHQGASASFGTQLERLGTMTVEGRLENQRVWNTSGQPLPGTQDFGISSLKVATALDTRDQYPFPHEGVLMNLSYESALVKVIGT